jgi:hypothetical protein
MASLGGSRVYVRGWTFVELNFKFINSYPKLRLDSVFKRFFIALEPNVSWIHGEDDAKNHQKDSI